MSEEGNILPEEQPQQGKILSAHLASKNDVYLAYMPFIKQGGLFIATTDEYEINEELFLLLKLLDEPEKHTIACRVIWITPYSAQGNLPAGIGLQFIGDNAQQLHDKIEIVLAGTDMSDRGTSTM